jgi:hypothetical protein
LPNGKGPVFLFLAGKLHTINQRFCRKFSKVYEKSSRRISIRFIRRLNSRNLRRLVRPFAFYSKQSCLAAGDFSNLGASVRPGFEDENQSDWLSAEAAFFLVCNL